jgi:hypothetical protein
MQDGTEERVAYPAQTYKFEEVQRLVFRVYDVDTFYEGFDNNNTEKLDLGKQVRPPKKSFQIYMGNKLYLS